MYCSPQCNPSQCIILTLIDSQLKIYVVYIWKKTENAKKKWFLGRFPSLATILQKMPFLHSKNELKRGQNDQNSELAYYHIDTTYIKLEWNSKNFLIFWCTLINTLGFYLKYKPSFTFYSRHNLLKLTIACIWRWWSSFSGAEIAWSVIMLAKICFCAILGR